MTGMKRTVILGICGMVTVGAIGLNLATGSMPFTRFASEEIEQIDAEDDLAAAFGDSGLMDSHGELGRLENRFAFGWLPAGPGAASISVATTAGPAFVVGAGVVFLTRRKAKPVSVSV